LLAHGKIAQLAFEIRPLPAHNPTHHRRRPRSNWHAAAAARRITPLLELREVGRMYLRSRNRGGPAAAFATMTCWRTRFLNLHAEGSAITRSTGWRNRQATSFSSPAISKLRPEALRPRIAPGLPFREGLAIAPTAEAVSNTSAGHADALRVLRRRPARSKHPVRAGTAAALLVSAAPKTVNPAARCNRLRFGPAA
jgi:hypothetical protein